MMIVSLTRDPVDVAAIRASGVQATLASSVMAGLDAASHHGARLIVCDVNEADASRKLVASLRETALVCPLLLRHDLSRQSIEVLYSVSAFDVDARSSFRAYDDLGARLSDAARGNDANATCAILAGVAAPREAKVREFIGVMAILGERPVMQSRVAHALLRSASSFRAWLTTLRESYPGMPAFPRLNAHFVALHLVWRRERLGWTGKRAAAAAGFSDDKTCANYLRYHLGKTAPQILRSGGFDARMTVLRQMFRSSARDRSDVVRRI
jgi:hypothetical protein